MIRITCTHCQKPLSIDETKLPDREVTFPCPACKAKQTVDRRLYQKAETASQPVPPVVAAEDDNENEFGAKALLVGKNDPALHHAAKLVGFLPVHHADPARAREYYLQEFPQIVLLNPAQVTPPPLEAMSPIISVIPGDRRKSFFVLFADNIRTFDGNAAFLYGVNLVVAAKEIGQFPQIYREAWSAHLRLYGSMNAVLQERQSIH